MTIQEFYSSFENLWGEYIDIVYKSVPSEGLAAVQNVHETSKRDQFLMKLRGDFEPVKSNLMNRNPVPSIDTCIGELFREEQRLETQTFIDQKVQNSSPIPIAYAAQGKHRGGRDMSTIQSYSCKGFGHVATSCTKKFCNYCKKAGHIIKDCPIRPPKKSETTYNVSVGSSNAPNFVGNFLLVCSICFDSIVDSEERSFAELKCGHQFHLDCIGTTFNLIGAMICPDCGQTEDGNWLYGNDPASLMSDTDDSDNSSAETFDYVLVEDQFGVFRGFPGGHSSYEQEETSPTPNHELLGNHAIFDGHMAASPLVHSHAVHIPPIPSAISDSANVDNPVFDHRRYGQAGQNEPYNRNPFLAANVQCQSLGRYSTPISDVNAILRPGPLAFPLLNHDTSFPRLTSFSASSFNHLDGSITCSHVRVQASHAGHPPQHDPTSLVSPIMPGSQNPHEVNMGQSSSFPGPPRHYPTSLLLPIMPGGSRFSTPTRFPLLVPTLHSATAHQGRSNIVPHSGSQNPHEVAMGQFSYFRSMSFDRDSGSGSQQQTSDRAEPSHRYRNL